MNLRKKVIIVFLYFCSIISAVLGAQTTPAPTPPKEDSHVLFEKAKKAYQEKHYKEAKNILMQLVAKHPLEDYIPKAKLFLANLEEDFTVSTKRFQMLAQEYGGRPEGEEAQRGLGTRYYLSDKYAEAADSYKELIQDYPKGSYLTEARYWLGCSLLAMDKNKEAVEQYEKVAQDSSDSPWAPKACLGLGNAYLKMKDYPKAEKQYLRILDRYHSYEELNLVYFKLGQTYELEKKPRQARAAYQTLLVTYPGALETSEAKARIAALEAQVPELAAAGGGPAESTPTPPIPVASENLTALPTPTPIPPEAVKPIAPLNPFHVQVGVYTRKENVAKAEKDVKKAGYHSFVVTAKQEGVPYSFYKVRVGHFADRPSAEKVSRNLSKRMKQKTIIVED